MMAPRHGVGVHLTHIVLLAGFSALIFYVTRVVPETQGSLWTIAAIGFLLLSGTLLSELLGPLGLPHLTGYLIAGIASGPYALKLVDEHTVKNLSPINTLALSLIALAGGAELDSRDGAPERPLARLGDARAVRVRPRGGHGPVLRGRPADDPLHAVAGHAGPARRLAAMGSARRDAQPVGDARHPLADARERPARDVHARLRHDVGRGRRRARRPGARLRAPAHRSAAGFSLDSFAALGHEIVGSVALGTTLGLVIALYLRLVNRQMLVVLLVLGFGVSTVHRLPAVRRAAHVHRRGLHRPQHVQPGAQVHQVHREDGDGRLRHLLRDRRRRPERAALAPALARRADARRHARARHVRSDLPISRAPGGRFGRPAPVVVVGPRVAGGARARALGASSPASSRASGPASAPWPSRRSPSTR